MEPARPRAGRYAALISAHGLRAGRLQTYVEAIGEKYRFYSYGDCRLIV
jgi:S-adenosylmethionine:tRNA-ribosyltransferase-isomerase (queuine synthetase)